MKVVMIDDVATTGGSVVNGIKSLKEVKIKVEDAYVIVNRMEGADEALKDQGVTLHSITNIIQITKSLHEQNLVGDDILQKVHEQIKIK
jgi:orotate phosphoribosyltransferase